jgi:polyferredoxin
VVFLGLCLGIYLRSLDPFSAPANPFLRLDPLIWLTHRTADLSVLLPPAGLLLLTVLLGRFFCGWICPLGALIGGQDRLLAPLRRRNPVRLDRFPFRRHLVRTPPALLLLGMSAATAFLSPPVLPYLHPNVWIIRIFSLSLPGLAFWGLLALLSLFAPRLWCVYLCPLGAFYGLLARLASSPGRTPGGAAPSREALASAAGVARLGVALPVWRWRIRSCSGCGRCRRCPMEAADRTAPAVGDQAAAGRRRVLTHQCILCFAFEDGCPVGGFAFTLRDGIAADGGGTRRPAGQKASDSRVGHPPAPAARPAGGPQSGGLPPGAPSPGNPPLSRRRFLQRSGLLACGALVGGALLGGAFGRLRPAGRSTLLRPPGVLDENRFLQRCLRCLQCVRSCPNRIIRATTMQAPLESLLTPHLEFGPYGCDYYCQVCQLVCPNGAIPRQSLAQKQATPIGKARIDRAHCVVYRDQTPCLVCEEFCPVPEKAIRFEETPVLRDGRWEPLQTPFVVDALCNGCGICQANCPADPLAICVEKR